MSPKGLRFSHYCGSTVPLRYIEGGSVVAESLPSSPAPRSKTKRIRSPYKLNVKKVLSLRRRGLSTHEIAKHEGVAPSTVWRYLDRSEPDRVALERFKENRADVFAELQGKTIGVKHRIIQLIEKDIEDGVLNALNPQAKAQYLNVLNNVQGTIYDKERLERGESTSNVSVVSKMVDSTVSGLYKRKPLKALKGDDGE
jgi:predicted transcriptional regulator